MFPPFAAIQSDNFATIPTASYSNSNKKNKTFMSNSINRAKSTSLLKSVVPDNGRHGRRG